MAVFKLLEFILVASLLSVLIFVTIWAVSLILSMSHVANNAYVFTVPTIYTVWTMSCLSCAANSSNTPCIRSVATISTYATISAILTMWNPVCDLLITIFQ